MKGIGQQRQGSPFLNEGPSDKSAGRKDKAYRVMGDVGQEQCIFSQGRGREGWSCSKFRDS
jgi:hypothetical protein